MINTMWSEKNNTEKPTLSEKTHLTGRQMRAARALLGWSQDDLASKSGVGLTTIRRTEVVDGPVKMIRANIEAVVRTLADAGVELLEDGGEGVRLQSLAE